MISCTDCVDYCTLLKAFTITKSRWSEAVPYVDQLLQHTVHTHSHINHSIITTCMKIYQEAGQYQKAIDLFNAMETQFQLKPQGQQYGILVYCCSGLRQWDDIYSVVHTMQRVGVDQVGTTFIASCMDVFIKAGKYNEAIELGNRIQDIFTITADFTTINNYINAYAEMGDTDNAVTYFNKIDMKLNIHCYITLLKAFTKANILNKYEQASHYVDQLLDSTHLHKDMDHASMTTCLDVYVKAGHYEKVVTLFNDMETKYDLPPQASHYALLVRAYARLGQLDRIHTVIHTVHTRRITLDAQFMVTCMDALIKAGKYKDAIDIGNRIQSTLNITPDNIILNTYINAYAEMRDIDNAKLYFDKIPHPDIHSYSTILKAFTLTEDSYDVAKSICGSAIS